MTKIVTAAGPRRSISKFGDANATKELNPRKNSTGVLLITSVAWCKGALRADESRHYRRGARVNGSYDDSERELSRA